MEKLKSKGSIPYSGLPLDSWLLMCIAFGQQALNFGQLIKFTPYSDHTDGAAGVAFCITLSPTDDRGAAGTLAPLFLQSRDETELL